MCLFLGLGFSQTQDRIPFNQVYQQGELTYLNGNNQSYTGVLEKRRANGHLVYEERYKSGYPVEATTYYNRTTLPVIANKVYYFAASNLAKLDIDYSLDGSTIKYKHYNRAGKKTLEEHFVDGILIYRCEFTNGKKDGIEYCVNKDQSVTYTTFTNGKRQKN